MATGLLPAASLVSPPPSSSHRARRDPLDITSSTSSSSSFLSRFPSIRASRSPWPSAATLRRSSGGFSVLCCLPPTPSSGATPSTKLYVSGTFFFPFAHFLDGRVIFVEVAKPRSEVRQASRQTPQRYRA
ncbi:hypothetical protein B296_00050859 [Ensete ventricosum]|uniref:Uncharacterized protein n=1 Tax=Ensete ventricosum TaxID=4639 RepID=A0A426YJ90_ENSVE|nr:hypothetical protein B296_00050859 [Ensete ventricosum]